ncbi:uncharacterized protein VDAG_02362 [Verticillium dahliae VdLs.17]|uniref:Uncharacterized protein n=1 Tax=Verticillium dahliae (strain VdLs.17 / ATCC MYA-4575 / FGSC 10137) TaxID=498257 RepID=G2WXN0_VERDV|nr:uncharacterized protein VDAG_02362 [Verticillium dahliae VdLs.17]EGY20838.1 hypothetical protein VDAG_02362 [Verticillium dahliae VdLs.17]
MPAGSRKDNVLTVTKPFECETALGAFQPGALGGSTRLLEASEKLYRLCHATGKNPVEVAKSDCPGSKYDIAFQQEHRRLEDVLKANSALTDQLVQARANEAYYKQLWTMTARQTHMLEEKDETLPASATNGPMVRNSGTSAHRARSKHLEKTTGWSSLVKLRVLAEFNATDRIRQEVIPGVNTDQCLGSPDVCVMEVSFSPSCVSGRTINSTATTYPLAPKIPTLVF